MEQKPEAVKVRITAADLLKDYPSVRYRWSSLPDGTPVLRITRVIDSAASWSIGEAKEPENEAV